MKKLLSLLTMALIAICVNAQSVIAEIDWSQEEAFNNWCSGENGSTAVVGAEGLEINVPSAGDNYWNPQTVVLNIPGQSIAENPDAPAFLEEDGAYRVIITAKHPAGHLMVNLGTWDDGVSLQQDFDVVEATDFEDIVVDFSEGWPADCFSNVHVLWMSGALPGLSVIKKVQIVELNKRERWIVAGDKALLGVDWDASYLNNRMKPSGGEILTLSKKELALSKGTYQYKVFNATNESYPNSNASLVIDEDGIYDVNFTFNTITKELSATATRLEIWTIAGDKGLLGSDWDATDKANKMRLKGENFTLTKFIRTLPKGTYQYKAFRDYSTKESYPSGNASLTIEEEASYSVYFTFNVVTKEVNATATKNALSVIAEIDWSQEEAFNNWCSGENGSTAVVGAEGLEINVPAAGENYWNPQTVALNVPGLPIAKNPDAPAILEEDGAYTVIITAKHPAGHLQVNLGTWDDGVSLQKDFDVAEATDFEDIIVEFDGWPADCFSNVHVLWMSGALPGLSVIKKVQIIELKDVGPLDDTKYKLTYMVDGEEYKEYEIIVGSKITPEAEPTKEGFTFSGWIGLPEYMPAENVTVTGTFTETPTSNTITISSAGQATFCSNQPLDFSGVSGISAYIACGFNQDNGKLLMVEVQEVPAGTGLFVKGSAGSYTIPVKTTSYYYLNLLKPVFTATTIPETECGYTNYVLGDGVNGVQFYKSANASLAANKAYLQLPTKKAGARSMIEWEIVDDATAIRSILMQTKQQDAIYNLNGQRVTSPRKGIYVKDGKKVFIK